MAKRISVHELENLQIGEKFEFQTTELARSIPKEKMGRPKGLDQNEAKRPIKSGKLLNATEKEFEVVGRKVGNGRHLYHFFFPKK